MKRKREKKEWKEQKRKETKTPESLEHKGNTWLTIHVVIHVVIANSLFDYLQNEKWNQNKATIVRKGTKNETWNQNKATIVRSGARRLRG